MSKAQKLIILEVYKNGQVRKYEIEKTEFVLGRGSTSEVPLDEPGISREHIKIFYMNNHLQLIDLSSSNGTSVNQIKLTPNVPREILPFDVIRIGNTSVTLKVKIYEFSEEAKQEVKSAPQSQPSMIPKPQPTSQSATPSLSRDLAKDALREVEEAKLSILKNAEAQKNKIIEEAKRLAKLEVQSAFDEHEKSMEFLLEETRKQVAQLKEDAERVIQEKKLQSQEELNLARIEHEESLAEDKANYKSKIDRDNKHKLEILKERLQADVYAERNKLITEAENEILSRKRTYQAEHEQDKKTYLDKINELNNEIANKRSELSKLADDIQQKTNEKLDLENIYQKLLENIDHEKKAHEQSKAEVIEQLEYEKLKLLEAIQTTQEDLDEAKKQADKELKLYEQDVNDQKAKIKDTIQDSLKEFDEQQKRLDLLHREIEKELDRKKQAENEIVDLKKTIHDLTPIKLKALDELQEVNLKVTAFNEKKNQLQDQVTVLQKSFFEEKNKIKHDLDLEYQTLKHAEQAKFDDFKAKQLKELQKVREDHTNTLQMMGQNLAKEISHSLELQTTKNGSFDYESSVELINSIIQVKTASLTGTSTVHAVQIDNYKVKKRGEKFKTLLAGATLGVALLYAGNYVYTQVTTDPRVAEMVKLKEERQKREIANKYTPDKTELYHESYVDATLFTKDYADAYLNDANQREWVQYATKYFLKNWKVEEEKTIKVISATRALVQNIQEAEGELRKSTLKQDLEKLKNLEKESAASNSKVLGSFVRLEAYKKQEKEFFMRKMGYRKPAGK